VRKLVLPLLLLLSACATQAPISPPPSPPPAPAPRPAAPSAPAIPEGKAAVHLYRRALPMGPAILSIYDAGHPVGTLKSGTYLDYYADPGPRSLKALGPGAGSIPYATSFRAGQDYYFLVYFLGSQEKGDTNVVPVDATTATRQMAALKPSGSGP
jgi:hypothetical protein